MTEISRRRFEFKEGVQVEWKGNRNLRKFLEYCRAYETAGAQAKVIAGAESGKIQVDAVQRTQRGRFVPSDPRKPPQNDQGKQVTTLKSKLFVCSAIHKLEPTQATCFVKEYGC